MITPRLITPRRNMTLQLGTGLGLAALLCLTNPALAADHRIEIRDMAYSVASLAVAAGDTVTFTNRDGAPHSATARDGSFDTGLLSRGESATISVTARGTIAYFCTLHPMMKGQLQVN